MKGFSRLKEIQGEKKSELRLNGLKDLADKPVVFLILILLI